MNIPENILQQVADAAFAQSSSSPLSCVQNGTNWKHQPNIRRAIIQHAITNPALAPFLAGGIGEYTDMEIADAWRSVNQSMPFVSEIKRFLSALQRRESPALAEPEPEPAAQVPLGPEDVKPGSVLRNAEVCWYSVKYVLYNCVCIDLNGRNTLFYQDLKTEGWQINTSIPDTGRWDANAWRPCSKPGK